VATRFGVPSEDIQAFAGCLKVASQANDAGHGVPLVKGEASAAQEFGRMVGTSVASADLLPETARITIALE
jgi:hypothetical protein